MPQRSRHRRRHAAARAHQRRHGPDASRRADGHAMRGDAVARGGTPRDRDRHRSRQRYRHRPVGASIAQLRHRARARRGTLGHHRVAPHNRHPGNRANRRCAVLARPRPEHQQRMARRHQRRKSRRVASHRLVRERMAGHAPTRGQVDSARALDPATQRGHRTGAVGARRGLLCGARAAPTVAGDHPRR